MPHETGGRPTRVATWEIDEETGEVEDLSSYTNWD